jgi:signal transduction histidine kinase
MKTLGSRLTCWYALVVMCTVISTMIVGYWLLRKELVHGIDLLNAAEFREICDRVQTGPRPVVQSEFLQRLGQHASLDQALYFFQARGQDGAVLFRSPNMRDVVFAAHPAGQTNRTGTYPELGAVRVGQFGIDGFQVQVGTSLDGIHQFSGNFWQVGLIVSGLALISSIFFGHRLSRLALDPIRRIQQTARRISADNLSARIATANGNDEIADLGHLLNQMFDRLEISFQRLSRFAGEASHELKTPLAVIRLQSEKLLLHGNLVAGQQEVVQQQLESINRLNSVIDSLLFLAKSEVGAIRPNVARQETAEFIDRFREDAQVLCEDQDIVFEVVRNEPMEAVFDATLIRQVLLNLVTNALRITPVGGRIALASWQQNSRWMVTLEDHGPGLPEAQLKRVFEPFARVDPPGDGGQDAGTGLGLAICRGVLEVHHGRIYAENRHPGPGLRVSFELPVTVGARDIDLRENAVGTHRF